MVKTIFGTAIGIALGFAVAFGNFGDLALVGLFALVGFAVSKVIAGNVDLSRAGMRRWQRTIQERSSQLRSNQ